MSIMLVMALLAAPQAAEAKPQAPAKERRICRKFVNTGSLVQGKRECRTAAEWDKLAQAARAGGQHMIESNAGGIITN